MFLLLAAGLTGALAGTAQAAPSSAAVAASNPSLARLFTLLTHEIESDVPRPHLVRYEEPIAVELEGPGATRYERFVARYMGLLRRNSGIDISMGGRTPNLHVRFVGRGFSAVAPGLSCLVAPGDVRWEALAAEPGRYGVRATAQATAIRHMTVFIPSSASDRRTKSCLLEEIAQALGPARDLYGVGDTIFNDDDAHMWPTDLDYLMLRVLYSPELRTGMDREATARAALRVLERLNPAGGDAPDMVALQNERMRGWRRLVHRAGRPNAGASAVRPAQQALAIAEKEAPDSSYHCHSLIILGKVAGQQAPERGIGYLDEAREICRRAHGPDDVRLSWIETHRADILGAGRHRRATDGTDGILSVATDAGGEELAARALSMRRQAQAARAQDAPASRAADASFARAGADR